VLTSGLSNPSPLPCRRIKVIGDTYVDREFGTGALKITPGHDTNDYDIGKRAGLEIINIMNNDGTLNAAAGKYEGVERFDARKRLWADLEVTQYLLPCELDPGTPSFPFCLSCPLFFRCPVSFISV
jgi:valyl-tRNA synthetase